MDCERFDKTTMDLLYGELDELSEAASLRHLHHCTRCREIWGHLRTTRELAEIPLEAPPSDLFQNILDAEEQAHRSLPVNERFSRAISVLAGYAMRPQLAMAALLLLMIGSSLVFVRTGPLDHGKVSITEGGKPYAEPPKSRSERERAMVFEGSFESARAQSSPSAGQETAAAQSPTKGAEASHTSSRETYAAAMTAYQEGRYAEAERLFSEVANSGSEQSASAALHEGHAARNGSGCQRAATLYDSVAASYPGSTVSDEASWHAASCYRALGQVQRASAHYEKLKSRPAFAERAEKALSELLPRVVAADAATSLPDAEDKATAPAGVSSGEEKLVPTTPTPNSKAAAKPPAIPAKPAAQPPQKTAAPKPASSKKPIPL